MPKSDSIKQDDIPTYFLRWHEGTLSRAERKKLETWLNASPGNRKEWELFSQAWNAGKQISIPEGRPAEEQGEDYRVKISGRTATSRLSVPPGPARSPFRLAIYGLTVVGIFLAGIAMYQRLIKGHEQQFAPYGQRMTLNLQDETVVELGPGSTLEYPTEFDRSERRVSLTGEAYFSIAAGNRPFVVATEKLDVWVTGTKFNVRTWHGSTQVYVQEGVVEAIGLSEATQTLRISSRQLGVLEKDSLYIIQDADVEQVLGWREGRLAFRETPLPQVVADLERAYGVKIDADDILLRHSITASFDRQPVNEVLDLVALAVGGRVTKTERGYRVEE